MAAELLLVAPYKRIGESLRVVRQVVVRPLRKGRASFLNCARSPVWRFGLPSRRGPRARSGIAFTISISANNLSHS